MKKRLSRITVYAVLTIVVFVSAISIAQSQGPTQQTTINPGQKKFHWGFSYNNYWSTIKGSQLSQSYFTKPSLGFNLKTEYYLMNFLGVGVGVGYQQRGAGVTNTDVINTPGNSDSTSLERLRFNTLEVPFSFLLRTPKDMIKGIRLSGSASVVPMSNFKSVTIFHSVDDGHHLSEDVSKEYFTKDIASQFTIGADIQSSETQILQVHFVLTQGTKNVYKNGGSGHNQTVGFRISILF